MDGFGWWELRAILLVSLVKVPSAWQMAVILFTAPTPPKFWCESQQGAHDPCAIPCNNYRFSDESVTLVTQWQLVCDRDVLVPASQVSYLLGILVGGVVCTILLNRFSPKRLLIAFMMLQVAGGVMVAHAPQFALHCFFRFVTALSCAHMFTCGYIICTDITSGRARTVVACCFENMWSVGVITLAGLGYLLDYNWIHLQHAISVPTLLLLFSYVWIPDSPKWLMAKGRDEEALAILEEAAVFNGTKLASQNLPSVPMKNEVSWCELLRRPYFLAMHVVWATTVVTYYGALLNVKNVGPHIFQNTVIAGCAELVGVWAGLAIILWCPKKWMTLGTILLIGGAACVACHGLELHDGLAHEMAMLALAMSGRIAISASLTVAQVTSGELLPQVGVFSCVTFARIALQCAPFIGYLAMYGNAVSLSVFGGITVLGGLACFCVVKPSHKPKPRLQEEKGSVWTIDLTNGSYRQSGEFYVSELPNGGTNQERL